MIRQPKRDERRQIILPIELIMQDMELPILEHSLEMLYAMLEEAMPDDHFLRAKNTLVYIHEGKVGPSSPLRTFRRRD